MKKVVAKVAACSLLALMVVGCGGPTKFESAEFSDASAIQKNADRYWKRDGFWGGMKGVNKVAISQFNVEFVTGNTSKSGADALSVIGVMEIAGMGKRKREFSEAFKQELPTVLYDGFVTALKAEGYDVVPMEALTSNPAFAQLKAAAAGQTSSQNDRNFLGGVDRNNSSTIQTYPVRGLPLPDNGFLNFGAGNNMLTMWKIAGDSGAQGSLQVRIRVGLDDDGHAIIGGGSTIMASYNPERQRTLQGEGWAFKDRGTLIGGPQMRDDVPVIDAKEFKAFQGDVYTVNGPAFQASILKMYPAYARMAMVKLKG